MRRGVAAFRSLVFLFVLMSSASVCATTSTPEDEFKSLIRVNQDIQPLGESAFGEIVALRTGAVSFRQTDVHLAGAGLPIELIRRRNIGDDNLTAGALADWHLELPHIESLSADVNAYDPVIHTVPANSPHWYFLDDAARCSNFAAPRTIAILSESGMSAPMVYAPNRWWHGLKLTIPGLGDQDLLVRDSSNGLTPQMTQPNGSAYAFNLVTTSHWQVACLPQTSNGAAGEGFLVVSPDGTTYWMDWLVYVSASAGGYEVPGYAPMNRRMAMMLVSHVQDRFGNTLTYSYDGNGNLTSIQASDGRQLTLSYQGSVYFVNGTQPTLTSVTLQPSAGAPRVWSYSYSQYSGLYNASLSRVTLPDGSSWSFSLAGWNEETKFQNVILWDHNAPPCSYSITQAQWPVKTGTITAPSGLQGSFSTQFAVRGRSFVPYTCDQSGSGDGTYHTQVPSVFALEALVSKSYSGAGLSQQNWGYNFSATNESFSKDCSSGCASTVWTDVTDPSNNRTRYTFSNKFDWTEGKLLETDYFAGTTSTTPIKAQASGFAAPTSGPWPSHFGYSKQDYINAGQLEQVSPESQTVVSEDGDSYTRQVQAFDNFAQPTQVARSNSIAGQSAISEKTSYLNDLTHWVIGLPQETDNLTTNEVESLNTYNLSNVTLQSRARFGQTLMSYTYDGQGQLASFTDGNNHATNLGNYKLHIPQSISYPDGTSESIVVDDFGQISSVTDQAGNTTGYSYDAMGRVTGITYPSGDEVAWYPLSIAYVYVGASERGIAAGHWRRTTTKGGAITTSYFDAMLHPILSDEAISGVTGSDVSTATGYDWKGQKTFASYPVSGAPDVGSITNGTSTFYDAIGRPIQTQQSSELGALTTATNYLSGASRQVIDPKGNVTTTSYQVFDQPSYDAAILVQAPEGANQAITRDLYGNPTTIHQWGSSNGQSGDVTKLLIYDAFHRLCRTVEPESGSEVIQYDGANNLAWRAPGLSFSDTNSCDQSQVAAGAKVQYTYDAMNRVTQIAPPAGTQSTTFGYDALGNKNLASSGISQWSAHRNKLGLITDETLNVIGNGSNRIVYGHDAYGSMSTVSYPDSLVVSYAPDALGRATQAGSFASNVSYYPDGNVEGFIFGNGRQYVVQENARQLLSNFTYGTSGALNVSEDFGYDANGNITTVTDLVNGQRSKSFSYDGLNRLTQGQANGLWGMESYVYDPLNNLRARVIGGQTYTYNYDTTNLLRSITSGGGTVNSFGYDQYGNINNKNGNALIFDALNQLLQVPGYDSYAYDAAGRRVQKTPANSSLPTFYFYNQAGQLLYQYDASTAKTTDYVYLGKKLIARNESYVPMTSAPVLSVPATSNTGTYNVSWTAVTGATTYTLQEQINGGAWSTVQSSSALSWPATGKSSNTYRYQVQACNAGGCSAWSPVSAVTVLLPPGAPTVSSPATNNTGTYTVSWASVATATSYTLQQRLNGGSWSTVQNGANLSWNSTGLGNGTYDYKAQACNASGCSAWSNLSTTVVLLPPAAAPTLTGPSNNTTGSYTVSWTSVATATSYTLQEQVNGAAWTTVQSGNNVSWTASGHGTGTYGYQVQACNAGGCGSWSALVQTIVLLAPTSAPTLGVATYDPNGPYNGLTQYGQYRVGWTTVPTASSYTLQESTDSGNTWNTVQSSSATTWMPLTITTGNKTYRAQACNTTGCGPWSANYDVAIPGAGTPTITGPAISSTGAYTVAWTAVSGVTTYNLQEMASPYDGVMYMPSPINAWTTVQSSNATTWTPATKGYDGYYSYRVQACNGTVCGPWSPVVQVTVLFLPQAPSGVSVTSSNPSSGMVSIAWNTDLVPHVTYHVQETDAVNGVTDFYDGTTPGASGDVSVTGQAQFQVQTCNDAGCSPWSAPVSITLSSGD